MRAGKNKFIMAQYKQKWETSTEVLKDDEGLMMHEELYLEHCLTTEGGRLGRAAAASKWLNMMNNRKDYYTGMKGPEGSELRFRVSIADKVTFRNACRQVSTVETAQAVVKKADAAAVLKMKSQLLTGAGAGAGASSDDADVLADVSSVARQMIGSGTGAAARRGEADSTASFAGAFDGMNIAKLRAMADDDSDSDGGRTTASRTTTDAASVATAAEQNAQGKRKEVWFDADNEINKASWVWASSVSKLASEFDALAVQADEVLRDTARHKDEWRAYGLCQRRSEAASLVMGSDSKALKSYLDSVGCTAPVLALASWPTTSPAKALAASAAAGEAAAKDNEGDHAGGDKAAEEANQADKDSAAESRMEPPTTPRKPGSEALPVQSPATSPMSASATVLQAPCPGYHDLRTIETLRGMSSEYTTCMDMLCIKDTTAKIAAFRNAARSLLSSWRIAVKELQRTRSGYQAALDQSVKDRKAKRQAEDAKTKDAKKRKGNATMDVIAHHGTSKTTFSSAQQGWREMGELAQSIFAADSAMDIHPYIVSGIDIEYLLKDDGGPVAKSLREFAVDFKDSDVRKTAARAMRRSLDEDGGDASANDVLLNKMVELCPRGSRLSPGLAAEAPALKAACSLHNFGLKCHSVHSSYEKDHLWTCRLSVWGTRSVAIFRASEVQDYMRKKGIVGVDAKAYVQDIRREGLTGLLDTGSRVYFATVGPSDMLFTPSHSIVLEEVHASDTIGLRFGMVIPRDAKGAAAFKEMAAAVSTPAAHMSKSVASVLDSC